MSKSDLTPRRHSRRFRPQIAVSGRNKTGRIVPQRLTAPPRELAHGLVRLPGFAPRRANPHPQGVSEVRKRTVPFSVRTLLVNVRSSAVGNTHHLPCRPAIL